MDLSTWYFLFYLFTGEVVKIDGFGSYEACESYRQKIVKREFSKLGECQNEAIS